MATKDNFDLIIVGAGPGGYVAAVRAAQLGLKTACIEKEKRLGGVCLNVGCIPSKALLDSSEFYHLAKDKFAEHGIKTGRVTLDLATMMARKDKVVRELTENVRKLLEGNKIQIIQGSARLAGPDRVEVIPGGRKKKAETYQANAILLATGSAPIEVPGMAFNGKEIVSSTGALDFDAVPKHLGIVGGGYIGLELGSVWMRLGAKVTVVEMLPKIAMTLDGQVGRTLERILKQQGMEFRLNTKVAQAKVSRKKVQVTLEGSQTEKASFDKLLVAVGRRPLSGDLGLDAVGVRTDEGTGHVIVDGVYKTNVPSVYAIGDLIAGPALAHKASAEGIAAVENMAGIPGEVNYDAIPAVVYTFPEVASVGLTEEQVKERGIPYCVGSYPFSGAGRARCMGQTEGFVKLISHSRTDRVLGVHIIGARAADMIPECVLAMEFGASSEDIARTVHGHPTFSEALMEAAMAVRKCSIYSS
ncbi:Dihydrolipoamide dehydrogenase of 2-oxoglutarate dehydrogenase (EC [Olavius algarvensis associated proteobacterium Delta 3]|nr:Dihydrolipoamide dehydrogenase of 2-oxoglutarate dehydrogenase (EC [Olavius algarvensis associated proteobacterium Delta 3]CAB5173108.1 Dihydrolipoamide dehydrogenase of 2-oxoglutarate dehydrogenase (EC [Olavius algarvensis associated proteobacterium Delta 3]